MNPSHLRTLLVVLEQGSFAAAANRLGYTPSAVSQQIAALEQSVGVTLFDRGARNAIPTHAARVMATRAQSVLTELDAIEEAVRLPSELDASRLPPLRISVYPSLVSPLAPYLATQGNRMGEPARVKLSVRDPSLSVKALVDGEDVDVSVVYLVDGTELHWPAALQSVAIGTDPYLLVVPRAWEVHHPLQGAGVHSLAMGLASLQNRPWVMHHPGSSDSEVIERLFTAHRLQPQVVARADDFTVSLRLVSLGFAGAFIPRVALGPISELSPDVVVIDVPELQLSRSVTALISPRAPVEEVADLVAALQQLHNHAPSTSIPTATPTGA
nr:LysR family transcriptional regulator [Leucobacter exalbidus]